MWHNLYFWIKIHLKSVVTYFVFWVRIFRTYSSGTKKKLENDSMDITILFIAIFTNQKQARNILAILKLDTTSLISTLILSGLALASLFFLCQIYQPTLALQTIGITYSQFPKCFTARGFSAGDPTKGIRLVSSKVT